MSLRKVTNYLSNDHLEKNSLQFRGCVIIVRGFAPKEFGEDAFSK